MLSNSEFEQLQNLVIKKFSSKRYQEKFKDILMDIKELDESAYLCSKKEMTYSSVMYQVKYLKGIYTEALKETIQTYQEIIFPDFSYKNDLNAMINGPYALKLWLIRYLCLQKLNVDLSSLINEDIKNLSITQQYQKIDVILFNNILNVKVLSN